MFLLPPKNPTAIPPQSGVYGFNLWILRRDADIQTKVIGTPRLVPSGKEPACQCRRLKRRRFSPWVGKIPWKRK